MARGPTTTCCSALALLALIAAGARAQSDGRVGPGTPQRVPPVAAQAADRRAGPASFNALFPARTLWTLDLNVPVTIGPAAADGRVFFPLADDRIAAYDLESGTRRWLITAPAAFDLVVGDGFVFVAASGTLTALSQADGAVAWQMPLASKLAAPPTWVNGWLIAPTEDGVILAFRATDGFLVWRQSVDAPVHASVSIAADRVYVAVDDGRIVAIEVESGAVAWTHKLPGPATGVFGVDDQAFAGSTNNYFYALDARDGHEMWHWRTGADVVGRGVVDERNVYFVSEDNVLRALSRDHGVQRWMRLLPLRPTRGPLRVGSTLIVTGVAPTVRGYKTEDGSPAGDLSPGGDVSAGPVAIPGIGLPAMLVVSGDLAKGAGAMLVQRELEPAMTKVVPFPNPVKP